LFVTIEDGILTIEGQRDNGFEFRSKHMHVLERNAGTFSRSVELPDNIIEDEVEATMENGVLTVEVFKNDPDWND
ncbi:heat shock protein, partial [Chytriomyces sp. MP71]